MLTEFRIFRIADMLKTVYPLKLRFAGGHNYHNLPLSQLSANITGPKHLPFLESSPTPLPKHTTTKVGWASLDCDTTFLVLHFEGKDFVH